VAGYSERMTWCRDPPRALRVNREQILESVDRSLQRLQTDHIDLLQVRGEEGAQGVKVPNPMQSVQ